MPKRPNAILPPHCTALDPSWPTSPIQDVAPNQAPYTAHGHMATICLCSTLQGELSLDGFPPHHRPKKSALCNPLHLLEALYGQQLLERKKEKRKWDLKDITCFRCGQKGHLHCNYLSKVSKKSKGEKLKDEKLKTQGKSSNNKLVARNLHQAHFTW